LAVITDHWVSAIYFVIDLVFSPLVSPPTNKSINLQYVVVVAAAAAVVVVFALVVVVVVVVVQLGAQGSITRGCSPHLNPFESAPQP